MPWIAGHYRKLPNIPLPDSNRRVLRHQWLGNGHPMHVFAVIIVRSGTKVDPMLALRSE